MIKNPISIGDKFPTTHSGEITVIKVKNSREITVMFTDGTTKVCAAKEVRDGRIKNNLLPNVCGVGYKGIGPFPAKVGNSNTPEYEVWRGILRRCYHIEHQKKHPTYISCTVVEEWHNFQNFAEWYTKQKGYAERWPMDKDLTVFGNKVYSPETCSLIPIKINSLLNSAKNVRGKYPMGVYYNKEHDKYIAQIHKGAGQQEFLGGYSTPEEAFAAYKLAKEEYVKSVAEANKEFISEVIYNNLMNYTVSITD